MRRIRVDRDKPAAILPDTSMYMGESVRLIDARMAITVPGGWAAGATCPADDEERS